MKSKNYFKEVCELIESGFTICEAIDELSIDSKVFYKIISEEQRLFLTKLRAVSKSCGAPGRIEDTDTKDLQEFFTNEEYAY